MFCCLFVHCACDVLYLQLKCIHGSSNNGASLELRKALFFFKKTKLLAKRFKHKMSCI